MKKCPRCFTNFEDADYIEHQKAHIAQSLLSKQRTYEFNQLQKKSTRHATNEACNCPFYGVRNYCEVLKMEVK